MFESLLESFNKPGLRFFIFDSKSDHLIYGDKDFDEYHVVHDNPSTNSCLSPLPL